MKTPTLIAVAALGLSSTATSQTCFTTLFARDNSGGMGWATYFDVSAQSTTRIVSLEINSASAPGTSGGVEVWTRTGTYAGSEATAAGWTLVATDDGGLVTAGFDQPTPVALTAPIDLPGDGSTTGFAIVYLGIFPTYTNGTPTNQQFTNGNLTINLGSVCDSPFSGGTVFDQRIFNGSLCGSTIEVGTNYCIANANSTGQPGVISAIGSSAALDNDVTLIASELPTNSFGYFLTSQVQGFVSMPGGSAGTLCLVGAIGRYTGAGQIQSSGLLGRFALTLDLTVTPTPTGFVNVSPGETWYFQAWHRDAVGGQVTSNFTDGLQVDFQ
ncbi:MAG: hypothetical protein AAF726_03150 [Planctomycetota bacterium]